MGREALEAAIENYRNGTTGKRKLEGHVVCVCFGVTENKIRSAIQSNGLATVEQVTNYTQAGGGCGGCIPELEKILAEMNGKKPSEEKHARAAKPQPKKLNTLEKIRLIEKVIQEDIRPELKKHGGDLELVDIDGNNVIVKLLGSCTECGITRFTLNTLIEPKLRQKVSSELAVMEGQ